MIRIHPFEGLRNAYPRRGDDFACYSCAERSYFGRRLPVGQF